MMLTAIRQCCNAAVLQIVDCRYEQRACVVCALCFVLCVGNAAVLQFCRYEQRALCVVLCVCCMFVVTICW